MKITFNQEIFAIIPIATMDKKTKNIQLLLRNYFCIFIVHLFEKIGSIPFCTQLQKRHQHWLIYNNLHKNLHLL